MEAGELTIPPMPIAWRKKRGGTAWIVLRFTWGGAMRKTKRPSG